MKNTIVLGDGYIGSAYKELLGLPVINRADFDYLVDPFEKLKSLLEGYDTVINCIAITDTKWSEQPENFKTLWWVNAHLVKELSDYCKESNRKLVHISTGDLYGNWFDYEKTVETQIELDIASEYRFTKLSGDKFCNPDDLILRIRLPFDGRNHPKNLLVKTWNFPSTAKFYSFMTSITYIPDLVYATERLVQDGKSGIYNVVTKNHEGNCCYSIINIWNEVLKEKKFEHIDGHNYTDHPQIIYDLSQYHIHNIINTDKLMESYRTIPLFAALITSWEKLKKDIDQNPK